MSKRWPGIGAGSHNSPRMADLSPELAGKVLGADLRNLVKKVGEGANLNEAERDMMGRFLADSTPPEELLRARRMALVVKWAKAGKLSKEEKKEAGIPEAAASLQRQTTERYQRGFAHYATLYQRDVRNIKRMVSDGRKRSPHDFPPFDDPPSMAAWFRRVKGQEPRDNLTKFEIAAADASATAAADDTPRSEAPATGHAGDDDEEEDDGFSQMPEMQLHATDLTTADVGLQQIQSLVAATFKQMQLALRTKQTKAYSQLRREWQQLIQVQRAWEKDIVKIQEGRGEVLRTREVNTELVQVFTTLGHSIFNVLQRVIREYAPTMPGPQQRSLAISLRDGCYAHVKKTRWVGAWDASKVNLQELEAS